MLLLRRNLGLAALSGRMQQPTCAAAICRSSGEIAPPSPVAAREQDGSRHQSWSNSLISRCQGVQMIVIIPASIHQPPPRPIAAIL